ncbi:MAG TPA: hypothetical protein ENK50_08765 [Sedimenticola sp.]|nr:hypothetical protein [Sedimenticola sp.]
MNRKAFIQAATAALFTMVLGGPAAVAATNSDSVTAPAATPVQPVTPSSIESLIEQRRDQLRRERKRRLDLLTGRRWRQPPWENAWEDWMDQREDALQALIRARRDAMEARQDAWGRWAHPWTQWRRDWNKARRNAWELDRLNREEYYQRRFYGPW